MIGLKRVYSEESSSTMNDLMYSEYKGSAVDYYKFEEKIRKVKLEEVKKLAKIKEFSSAAIVPK